MDSLSSNYIHSSFRIVSYFCKKEVVIRTSAKITANACKLEVPIDTKIIENQLVENKEVKKEKNWSHLTLKIFSYKKHP